MRIIYTVFNIFAPLAIFPRVVSAVEADSLPTAPVPPAAPAQPSLIPDVRLSWSGYFEALAILCFLLALLWILLWFIRRRGTATGLFMSQAKTLQVENRLSLGPKKWILALRYMDRRLLIGVTEHNISLLTEIYGEDDEAPDKTEARPKEKDTTQTAESAAEKDRFTLKLD
ncbi:MAG: flagellar biosynthetic protein FliO [Desulfovibrio sp.]|jgi:flagellar protein FliO/FliZ|nr:flagellar biosynthetic protein FliO [Desulfovibrio sp.]